MRREILHQVDDNLGIQEAEADNIKLQKIMKENKHPSNLMAIKPPKLNPKIESCQPFQNSASFVMSNGKSLFSS